MDNNNSNCNSLFKNRLLELANRSYQTNTYTFTDFLSLAEQSDALSLSKAISFAGFEMFGGFDNAERTILRFGDEATLGYPGHYPIVCLHISPLMKKFSEDLSHRDFLGALMNLGIKRGTIGDIKISSNEAYIFCLNTVSDYIRDELTRVKHTSVKADIISDPEQLSALFQDDEPEYKQIVVSSLRADGVISKVYNLSRNESLSLFQGQRVYINSRLCENNSIQVKVNDTINVRGYGKFIIQADPSGTRKGRISLSIGVFR